MNPRKIDNEDDLRRVEQMLSSFYNRRPDSYGLMERGQHEYDSYSDVVERVTPPNGRVLDLGCGTYRTPLQLHQRGFVTTGCDLFSEEKLREYRQKVGASGPRLVSYDGRTLPFDGETFDTVATLCVFEHLTRVERTLEEIHRVLKKDGFVVILGPNLSGPHRTVLGTLAFLKGQSRFWQYRSLPECLWGGMKILSWGIPLQFSGAPRFITIYPLQENGTIKFEQPDDDAVHLNYPVSFRNYFTCNGYHLVEYNRKGGTSAWRRVFNRLFPSLATTIQIVARKKL